ncbi:MAG: Asp-tRNA(Asn)/Glu-tRNA(Gln) amidotransferase GatCAB subunit B, partial [Alphaproteobacteria bacterium]|nr:Asp-tRNA(Asn)/Glu-tRNA(Gln) amidotransferase GatCAB subunit B [Alphaproteobacteria bacterium]
TETKNVNSVRFVMAVVEQEAKRQVALLEDGGKVVQETRLYDPDRNETRSMRSKEDAHDYRYFPCPDLLPLKLTDELIERIRKSLPELPDQKKHRFMEQYGLTAYDAGVLIAEAYRANYFETVAKGGDAKLAANWVLNELLGRLNKEGIELQNSPMKAESLAGLLKLISDNTISGKIAKDVFAEMFTNGGEAAAIVEAKGLKQVTDVGAIEAIVDAVIAANPDNVAAYKGGKDKLFGFFVGQVMKNSGGKANPDIVNELLKKKLG